MISHHYKALKHLKNKSKIDNINNPKLARFKKYFSKFIIVLLFLIPSFVLFWQFFPQDLYPYPGNYMLAWYEPWKTDNFINGVITISHEPVAEDVFRQILPFRTLGVDTLKKAQPPLWNPYNGAGMPLLATNNTGIFDPFNILFFIFPTFLAWSLYISIQPIFIVFFTYLYSRKLKLGKTASLVSAFIFALSGSVITRYPYGIYGISYSLLPLGLFCVESFVRNKSSNLRFLLPIVIAFLIVSTQPQITFYIIFFFLIYASYRMKNKETILLIFLGLGISAVQLFPTAKLYLYANLTTDSSSFIFNSFLLKPLELLTIFIPNYFGNPSTYNYWGRVDYIQTAIYFGLVPFMFVFIALFKRKKMPANHILFFTFSFLITIFLIIDSPLTNALYSLPIPIVSTGIPERIFIISSLCLSLLAGYGINYWIFSKDKLKTYIMPLGLILLIALFILGGAFIAYKLNISCPPGPFINCRLISLRNTLLESMIFIIGFLVFLANFFIKAHFKKLLSYGIIFIILCIGSYNALKFIPYSPSSSFNPQNALITQLQSYSKGRVFGLGSGTILTDLPTYFRFYGAQYYHPLYILRYGELVSYGNSGSKTETLTRSDVQIINDLNLPKEDEIRRQRLFDLLGINYIFIKKSELSQNITYRKIAWQNEDWIVYKNSTAVPRMYFTSSYVAVNSDEKVLDYLFQPSFNPLVTAVLEKDPLIKSGNYNNKIISQKFSENTVDAQVYTEKSSILVVNDNFYSGWKAFIDGKQTEIFRTNYTFRSIIIPPGKHTVKMVFDPFAFKAGLFVTLFFCIFYILFILRSISQNNS